MSTTITTCWKKVPMKITVIFCSMPIPTQRMSSGIIAVTGR
jgi:hypothetical protein